MAAPDRRLVQSAGRLDLPIQLRLQYAFIAQDDQPGDPVFELTEIAGPAPLLQQCQRAWSERRRTPLELLRQLFQEMLAQPRNVFPAFPEWRQIQVDNV